MFGPSYSNKAGEVKDVVRVRNSIVDLCVDDDAAGRSSIAVSGSRTCLVCDFVGCPESKLVSPRRGLPAGRKAFVV